MSSRKPQRKTYQPLPLSVAALQRVEGVAHSLHGSNADLQTMADAVTAVSHVYTRERAQMASLDSSLSPVSARSESRTAPGAATQPDASLARGAARSDKRALLARAGFFWPRDLAKVFGPLDELPRWNPARWSASGAFERTGRTLRVLDVGAGLGATSFGVARWLRARGLHIDRLQVVALEQSDKALRGFGAFVRALADLPEELVPIELEARSEDLRSARLTGDFDLVLFGFVLNELFLELPEPERIEKRAELLRQACERLAPNGAVIVLEPALKFTTRELMQVRDALVSTSARKPPTVLAPCLHARACPMLPSERDWCHQELPFALTGRLAEIAKAASLRYEGLRYASLVLTNEPRAPSPENLYRVVSDRLISKGKQELIGCGPTYQRFTRLDRNETEANAAFTDASRGALIELGSQAARIEQGTSVTRR